MQGEAGGGQGGPAGSLRANRGGWARILALLLTPAPGPPLRTGHRSVAAGSLPTQIFKLKLRDRLPPHSCEAWSWVVRPGGGRASGLQMGAGLGRHTAHRRRRQSPGLQTPRPALLLCTPPASPSRQAQGSCQASSWAPLSGGDLLQLPGPREDPRRPVSPASPALVGRLQILKSIPPCERPRGLQGQPVPAASVGGEGSHLWGHFCAQLPRLSHSLRAVSILQGRGPGFKRRGARGTRLEGHKGGPQPASSWAARRQPRKAGGLELSAPWLERTRAPGTRSLAGQSPHAGQGPLSLVAQ